MNWAAAGSICMFTAVLLGAFGAHGLKNRLSSDMLAVFETGVRYQVYHALGLFVVAWLCQVHANLPTKTFITSSGWAFLTGILLFSGSLYALSLTGVRILGAITPLGGLSFLIGWGLIAAASLKA
jgi:uncharacterized membrane protein YgdD (TMEM256/DUF423 family)